MEITNPTLEDLINFVNDFNKFYIKESNKEKIQQIEYKVGDNRGTFTSKLLLLPPLKAVLMMVESETDEYDNITLDLTFYFSKVEDSISFSYADRWGLRIEMSEIEHSTIQSLDVMQMKVLTINFRLKTGIDHIIVVNRTE